MDQVQVNELAKRLHDARLEGVEVDRLSNENFKFSLSEAYTIQERGIEEREEAGEKIIASKMGLTSEAKRKQMDLHSPIYGILTDKMQLKEGEVFSLKGSIHPKIEPEIVFFFDKDVPENASAEQILEACSGVAPAMEILDSRFRNFKYFSLEDVVADNSSSSHYILGTKLIDPKTLNLKDLKMVMSINDTVAAEGNSSAISGDPVVSMMQQSELFAERGKKIKAGSFVLAGAATTAVALEPGQTVSLEITGMEKITLKIEA